MKAITVIIVKCVGCQAKRAVKAGEVAPHEQPTCERCGMPMVPIKAIRK